MTHFMEWLIRQNLELAILVCLILVVRIVFKKVLAPKAIYILWLIVLVKSFTYLNVPYISSKYTSAKSEVNIDHNVGINLDKSVINEVQSKELIDSKKSIVKQSNVVLPADNKAVQTKVEPSLYVSLVNYFTVDKIKIILFWLYLSILTVLFFHLIISLIKVRNLKSNVTKNDLLNKLLQTIKTKLKINSKIEIYESGIVPSPTLIGVRSFTILIPTNILGNISNTNLEDIITHELMHIRRKDTLVNLLFRIATCLYFYNPFIWLAYSTMKKDMESACDQDVLLKSDFKNNISYAESLLLIAKLCKQNGQVNQHAMMFIHKNTFKRIDLITNFKKSGMLSKVVFTILIAFALIVFVPSYRAVSEEVGTNSALDSKKISLDNKENEDTQIFLNKQLKNALGVKNIFIILGKRSYDFDFMNFKFEGTFKQFQDLVFNKFECNIVYHDENLYFTKLNKQYFKEELFKLNEALYKDSKLKKSLNSKIKSITFNSNRLIDAIDEIAKESRVEVDLVSKSEYSTIKVFKDAKIYKNTFQDISAWNLLVGLTIQFSYEGILEIKDGKIYLTKEVSWKKRYNKILEEQVSLEANEYSLSDFIQVIREKVPDLQIILMSSTLVSLGINDQINVKVNNKNGMLKTILKETLNQIKMDYELKDQALIVASLDSITSEKNYDETKKSLYLSTNKKINNVVDVNKLLEQPVFFDFANTSLKDGLEELSVLSKINFVYEDGVINEQNNEAIGMVANGMSVRNSLKWMLANVNLTFSPYKEGSIIIRKAKIVEIPATFVDIGKVILKSDLIKKDNTSKLIIVKIKSDFQMDMQCIDKIQINNEELRMRSAFEIISVENNYILVKITAGEIIPETACTIFYKE